MKNITQNPSAMSSIEFMLLINQHREDSGEKPHEPRKFLAKVEDELDGELTGKKFRLNNNQTESAYYDLSIEQCMLVGMRESKQVRRSVLAKLKAMESQTPAIPQTLSEALRLAADQAEFIEQQAELLEKQQPSVEFVERYVESSGTFGFREICKQLGAKENKFRAFLQSQKIMYRLGSDWTPYAQHMDKGLFEVKTGTANGHAYKSPRFTAKGAEWIASEWAKYLKKNPKVTA